MRDAKAAAARTVDDKPLREGSSLEVVLQPRIQKLTFWPVVDLLTENRTLSLTHRSFAIQTTLTWYLAEKPNGTQVDVQAVVNGLLPCVLSVLQQRRIVEFTLKGALRGLKKAAMTYAE